MHGPALNEQFLAGNTCLGCGLENPEGLRIRIWRDGGRTDRLVGTYHARATAAGFPGIVHGGAQFTALDCMAGWVVFILRNPGASMPLTTTATMRFHNPAPLGADLSLSAEIVREAGPREPFRIHAEIRDPRAKLLSEADFDYILVPVERFQKLAGIGEMPEGYRRHFATARR